MKNITKYILAAAAAFSSLTACQEFEDFEKTIDGTPGLVYVQTGTENLYTIRVVHKPTGSTGEFFTEFPVCCNTTRHAGVKATFVYDASLVESYNAEHKTSYAALPAEYLTLENTTLTVPENATASADSVKVTLTGDLSLLTERNYLAPLRIKAEGIDASEVMGAVYVAVATEINLIRAIESTDDMVGFTATGRSAWTADCGNYANLFDGSTSTSVDFPEQYGNVLNIDMKEQQLVTGLCLGYGSVPSVSIEYSADGENFSQAGTPVAGEYVTGGSRMYAAFHGHIEARYLRLTVGFSSSWSKYVSEFNIYEIESDEPTVYAMCGSDNVLTGAIAHTPGGSFNQLNAAFNVYCTVSSASGYSVSATPDNSLIAAYNSANGTSYAALPDGHLLLENNPCAIGPNNNKSDGQIKASLTGDLTGLTNAKGYLVPLKLSAQDAVTSSGRGVVYLVILPAEELFRKNFTVADITGALVADRSGWSITGGDYHSGSWPEVIDDSTDTFMRPWGSPIMFTITFDKEYEMTGLRITARTDNASYQNYQPNAITIEYSLNGEDYTELGTAASADGSLLKNVPSSYVALYGSQKMKYIRITASYGSNMGVGDFNIYAK